MLAQNRTLRRHALGRFPALLRAVTRDPAMLLLPLARRLRPGGAERELRARADGAVHARPRLHRARHPRGRARAHRLPRRLARRRQRAHLLRPRVPRRRAQAHLRQARPLRLARRARPVRAPPRPRAVPGRQALGLLRRRRRCARRPARGSPRVYRRSGHRIKPVVGAILAHPALYRHLDAPNMVKSPVVFVAGALRSVAARASTRDDWTWLLDGMGQHPFRPPSVAGWDWGTAWLSSNSMRVRFDAANYLLDTRRVGVEDGSTPDSACRRAGARARAGGPSATRGPRAQHRPRAAAHRRAADDCETRRRATCASPAARPTCASACCATCCSPAPTPKCTDDPRTAPATTSTAPPRQRASGGPGSRAARCSALGLGAGLALYARQGDAARSACSRPPPPTPPPRPTRRCWSRSSCPAAGPARHARAAAPVRPLRRPAPQAEGRRACRSRARASAFTRRSPRGVGGGVKGLFERGKIGFLPGIDYANPDLSHFHSRHFWETGLITDTPRRAGSGRWLDRHGGARQPAPGRVDGLRAVAGAALRPRARRGGRPRPATPASGSADVWGERLRRGDGRVGAARPRPRRRAARQRLARPPRGWPRGRRPARALRGARRRRPARVADRLPDGQRLRRAAALPRGLLSQPLGIRVADRRGRRRLRHPRQPGASWTGLLARGEPGLAAFQADLEARGSRRPRADLRLVGVRPPARGERLAAPTTAPAASPGSRAPRARRACTPTTRTSAASTSDGNLPVTVDFRRVYSSLLEQWLGTDAGAVIPSAGAFGRVALVR